MKFVAPVMAVQGPVAEVADSHWYERPLANVCPVSERVKFWLGHTLIAVETVVPPLIGLAHAVAGVMLNFILGRCEYEPVPVNEHPAAPSVLWLDVLTKLVV